MKKKNNIKSVIALIIPFYVSKLDLSVAEVALTLILIYIVLYKVNFNYGPLLLFRTLAYYH